MGKTAINPEFEVTEKMRAWAREKVPGVDIEAVARRFEVKVRRGDACHEWIAAKDSKGYGNFYMFGRYVKAPRAAWWLANGEPPPDMEVMHSCDNPGCVNLDHLSLGTHGENMADMVSKRRHVAADQAADKNPKAKLTWEDVREIREWSAPQRYLGWIYDVHPSVIGKIKQGAIWRE